MARRLGSGRASTRFPHVRIRTVNSEPEAYVVGTGLAVWEIVWLSRSHGPAASIAEQTYSDAALVSEGLRYADEHRDEVNAQVRRHTQVTAEELRALLPNIKVIKGDNGKSDQSNT